jgi:hypothetical protein
MSIAYQEPGTIPAETEIACPSCGQLIARRLNQAIESIRAAAKRPLTPELLAVCPSCQRMFVLSADVRVVTAARVGERAMSAAAADAVVDFVHGRGHVSFVELTDFLDGVKFPVHGDRELCMAAKNIVLWSNISPEFAQLMEELQTSGRLVMRPAHWLVYPIDGWLPLLPIAVRPPAQGYKAKRWLPVTFNTPRSAQRKAT